MVRWAPSNERRYPGYGLMAAIVLAVMLWACILLGVSQFIAWIRG